MISLSRASSFASVFDWASSAPLEAFQGHRRRREHEGEDAGARVQAHET